MASDRRDLDWFNVFFLTLSPFAAVVGVCLYIYHRGLQAVEVASFAGLLSLTGLAISAGYHRYYSHRTYECHPLVQTFYLVFGASALQNSALRWASHHRSHHRFVDREGDPHSIGRGMFWAHMGWIFYRDPPEQALENVPDLKADRLVVWQHRFYPALALAAGVLLPFLLGLPFGRPWGSLLWAGLLRVVVFHHLTFLINSAAHRFGTQPYADEDSSRDSGWLALLTWGEGYHNFHHTFPGDYRNGVAWHHWDPAKWLISGLGRLGLAWHLNRVPDQVIVRIRTQTAYERSLRPS